ncbi:MAG: ABC transporter permease [Thermomicrobiales bacterium]|jgi:ABC-type dipeptide/oligopeptide/nickel transport system permease component|nr:ABC transporter permease [Thermomicrobiales bacterium]
MGAYLARRLLRTVFVLVGVSVLVFSMTYLVPGDPVLAMLGEQVTSGESIENVRRDLGLDRSPLEQYVRFLGDAVQGDLGRSWRSKQPVTEIIMEQLPATLQLTLAGLGFAVVFGVAVGMIAGVHRNSWVDQLSMFIALIGVSMPAFWLGLLLILVFSVHLGWVPIVGYGGLNRLILPALTLGLQASAIIARIVRASILEELRRDYVTTARAKGLSESRVLTFHALRNALIPVVTVVGLQFGSLLGGAVVIETVFARQGIGRVAVTAITGRDFPLIQGIVLFAAVVYVLVNLGVDIIYARLNPQISVY